MKSFRNAFYHISSRCQHLPLPPSQHNGKSKDDWRWLSIWWDTKGVKECLPQCLLHLVVHDLIPIRRWSAPPVCDYKRDSIEKWPWEETQKIKSPLKCA